MRFLTDLRVAVRAMARRPGFAVTVILTIALGVAANASIFSVVDAALLQPIPVREPERLVRPDVRMSGGGGFLISTSIPNFRDWRERNRTFETFGLNAGRGYALTGGDRPEVIEVRLVLGDFFETLGVPPAQGRWITAAESDKGAAPIAVVSERFRTRHVEPGGDPIGTTITLDGEPFTIVGVMPPSFMFPSPTSEVFLPMGYFANRMCWEDRGCSQGAWVVGRLQAGTSLAVAQQDLDRIWRELNQQEGREQAHPELRLLTEWMVSQARTPLLVLMGAVVLVLLIACANVASLVLARGEVRRRDIAVRAALGASRVQIVTALAAESLVLAWVGGLLGLGLTWTGVRLLSPLVADRLPALAVERIGVNLPVALFALGIALASGLVFGLLPAWRSASAASEDLRHGNRTAAGGLRQPVRSALVIGEVALSLVLLTGAGLLIRSVRNLLDVDKGFDGANVLTAEVPLPAVRYSAEAAMLGFQQRLVAGVAALPGVTAVAIASTVPLSPSSWEQSIIPEGLDPAVPENFQSVQYNLISTDYFRVLGIPLLRGRLFIAGDREGGVPVAVIDETLAARFWPGEDPVGKRVSFEEGPGSTRERPVRRYRTVIGVVKNVRHYELETPSRIQVYVPVEQSGGNWTRAMRILIATAADPGAMAEPLRQQVALLDADVPLNQVRTMADYVTAALGETRIVGRLLTLFSALATGLAGLGLFGVLAYTVAQRSREIGVRVALGASARRIVGMVAGEGMRLALAGIGIGLAGALGLTRLLGSVLFEVKPVDPVTFGVTAVALIGVTLGAAVIPARRAARTDPAVVLREE